MRFGYALLLVSAAFAVSGCGGSGSGSGTTTPPSAPAVSSITPANGSAGVATNTAITATFSRTMNAATITSSSFTVTGPGGTPVTGTVAYSSATLTATFTPAASLSTGTSYTATIYSTATDSAGVALGSNYTWNFVTAAPPGMATIDFGTANQTIRGFGGSTAWMPAMPAAQVNALFGSGADQLGLSILRLRIDPGSTTGGSNWATELTNALEAQALGAIVIAVPWTPPATFKSNNSTIGGTLNPGSYAAFATYLESFVTYMASGGVNLYGISIQNEPDATVTYESCFWTGATLDTWIANNSSVLTTKLIMPESESFTTSYSDPALNDPNAVGHIAIIAGHLYGTSPSYYTNAINKGKEVWQTEHYLSPSGAQPTVTDALAAAKEIHDSLTVGNYNAYLWWWVADWNPGNGVTNYGLVDPGNNPTYFGYALAQYSKFIRPGYLRTNATASPTANIYLSAYSGNGHSVIVALNMGASSVSQPFTLVNGTVTTLTPWQTTSAGGLQQQSAITPTNNQFTYTLPAQSITTFVQ
jgi:glucuronoarabinoxylan endo-1,4-beta-xylanase